MSRLPYSHPGASWPPPPFWEGVTAVAALAAIGIPEIGPGVQFVLAGLLAGGAAGAAWCEALLRRRGRSSDIGGLITTVLAVSSVMTCVLGVAAGSSR
jgi:hypothetical protein